MNESYDARSDADLVIASLRSDNAAFEVLVRRYARAAYLVALAATGGVPTDAEDAVQDALILAHARLQECHSPDRFGAWLLRITRNRAHNVRRREQLRSGETLGINGVDSHANEGRNASAHRGGVPVGESHFRTGSEGPATPHAILEQAELRRHLLDALSREPEVRRQVLLLHDLEGWKHKEIADALDISTFMSRYYLSVTRRSMRARLAPYRSALEDE